jgi:glutathione S-transferase
MKLYGSFGSPYVARVVLCARLKGQTLTPEAAPGGGIKSPEFLALNPMGKMPVLDIDGVGLPESEVICEYLDASQPGARVIPSNALEAARARLLSRFYDVYIYPQTSALYRHLNPSTRDAAAVATATDNLNKVFGYIEHFLSDGPFAVGNTPSLAECGLLPAFTTLKQTIFPTFGVADPTQGSGKLARWWQACSDHPICGPFMKEYAIAYAELLKMLAARR